MNGERLIANANDVNAKPMSQAAIGRALGLAPSTMTKHKAAGMPMDSVESARAWHKAHTNIAQRKSASRAMLSGAPLASPMSVPAVAPVLPRPDGSAFCEDFDAARTREKIATANLAEIEEAALRGVYLVKADFELHLFNAGRMLRDTLTNCARRIGAEVSGLATAEECEAVIDREHRAALASFAQQLRHTLKIETENSAPTV